MFSWTEPRAPRRVRRSGRTAFGALGVLWAAAFATTPAAGQVSDVCPEAEPECARGVLSAADGRAGFALVAAGGAPVPGSASTLGRRTATSRRFTTALRATFMSVDALLPASADAEPTGGGTAVAFGVDGALALFDGFFAAPTVGGVLSVDALASAGWVGGAGPMNVDGAFTWGAGLRLGILRESFTLPGVSASFMVREVGPLRSGPMASGIVGPPPPGFQPAWVADADALVARLTLGKRIGAVDAFAGAGWDRVGGDLSLGFVAEDGSFSGAGVRDQTTSRWSALVGAGYTFLVFQVAGEAGWQQGGESHEEEGFRIDGSDGRFFGGFSFRFTY